MGKLQEINGQRTGRKNSQKKCVPYESKHEKCPVLEMIEDMPIKTLMGHQLHFSRETDFMIMWYGELSIQFHLYSGDNISTYLLWWF